MRTKDFIRSVVMGERENGTCSGVIARNGTLFSYGAHYPLLVKVGNRYFLNDRGYSSSTRRHIFWSYSFADGIYKDGLSSKYDHLSKEYIADCMKIEFQGIKKRLKTLSSRATRQKIILEERGKMLLASSNTLMTA